MGRHRQPRGHAPRELAVRVGGVLMLAGGVLAASTALLPPPAEGSEEIIVASAAIAAAIGAFLLLRRPEIGDHALGAIAVLGTALITIATHQGGESGGTADNEVLYLWICLYAFYFLALPYAIAQIGFVGLAYGWVLSEGSGTTDELLTRWLVTMTTLVVAGVVISRLRHTLYTSMDDLADQARHDGLTGLLNRAAFEDRVGAERARSMREGGPISVLALDVDGFKGLNDSLGHSEGDQILRQVAHALRDRTRGMDAVARVGGDEFAVLLPGASETEAQDVAEDLRTAIAHATEREDARVTISLGVTTGWPPAPDFEELWRAADSAMYAGKRAGGDRVCVMPARPSAADAQPHA
jgi:diguanylate cyclase (GGDEF)-like protein